MIKFGTLLSRHSLLLASFSFLIGAVSIYLGVFTHESNPPLWARLATLFSVCVGMALRNRSPLIGLAIGTCGFLVDVWLGASLATFAVYTDNLYVATTRGPAAAPRILLISASVLTGIAAIATYPYAGLQAAVYVGAVVALVLVSPVGTGIVVRQHRDRADLERDRAEKIAQLAEVDRRATLTEERTRMARELHDTVANHLSAVAMQSAALLARPEFDQKFVSTVVGSIRANSVAGLAEMRRTIEFLRDTDGNDDPVQHRVTELDDLMQRMTDAGLTVTKDVTGTPCELPIAVEFAAYRIIQEALTNALKHGRAATLLIEYTFDSLSIEVKNAVPQAVLAVPGSGNGLLGMRERATILGGSFDAGPCQEGWRVTSKLPITTAQVQEPQ